MHTPKSGVSASLFAEVFEDDRRGAAILEHLAIHFPGKTVLRGGVDAVLQTFYHDGQRSVIDYINLQLQKAHGGPDAEERTYGSGD